MVVVPKREWWLALLAMCGLLAAAPNLSANPVPYQTLQVPKDKPVYVVPGQAEKKGVLIYLHGRCGDPLAGPNAFPEASAERGTMISVVADSPCPNRTGRFRWTNDLNAIQARIDAAIDAVSAQRKGGLDGKEITLIGYSEGALRAEQLAKKFPDRYPRVVIIGTPVQPAATSFGKVKAVATMAGQLDKQDHIMKGTEDIQKSGKPVKFFSLPGVGHGKYGTEGNRVMGEVLSWIFTSAPP